MTHDLKTLPEPFAAIITDRKFYEIRRADRPFKVGDTLCLREWVPGNRDGYTGRIQHVEVTYLTPPGDWGLPADLCVLSIRRLPPPSVPASPRAPEGETK